MDTELALEVVGMLELFPESHDQNSWCNVSPSGGPLVTARKMLSDPPCGTTLCFAGWAAALRAPDKAVFAYGDKGGVFVPDKFGDYVRGTNNKMVGYSSPIADPKQVKIRYERTPIGEYARRALKLTIGQADYLFDAARTVDELLAGIRYLFAHPDATSRDLRQNFSSF